jgi:hypothetical protein
MTGPICFHCSDCDLVFDHGLALIDHVFAKHSASMVLTTGHQGSLIFPDLNIHSGTAKQLAARGWIKGDDRRSRSSNKRK